VSDKNNEFFNITMSQYVRKLEGMGELPASIGTGEMGEACSGFSWNASGGRVYLQSIRQVHSVMITEHALFFFERDWEHRATRIRSGLYGMLLYAKKNRSPDSFSIYSDEAEYLFDVPGEGLIDLAEGVPKASLETFLATGQNPSPLGLRPGDGCHLYLWKPRVEIPTR